jgi:thiamine-phosphate pyrophosphorylase
MDRRQTMPRQWLIVNAQPDAAFWRSVRALPRGSGILLLCRLGTAGDRRLRHLTRLRDLRIASETPWTARRVHNGRELREALLRRASLILISPIFGTSSHPDWQAIPRMRAAALARLAHRRATALGGMNEQRYAKIAPLGFIGWAGISAFRT